MAKRSKPIFSMLCWVLHWIHKEYVTWRRTWIGEHSPCRLCLGDVHRIQRNEIEVGFKLLGTGLIEKGVPCSTKVLSITASLSKHSLCTSLFSLISVDWLVVTQSRSSMNHCVISISLLFVFGCSPQLLCTWCLEQPIRLTWKHTSLLWCNGKWVRIWMISTSMSTMIWTSDFPPKDMQGCASTLNDIPHDASLQTTVKAFS